MMQDFTSGWNETKLMQGVNTSWNKETEFFTLTIYYATSPELQRDMLYITIVIFTEQLYRIHNNILAKPHSMVLQELSKREMKTD